MESSSTDVRAPIERVVVYESIQNDARVATLFRGFETRLQDRLAACHVQTTVRHGLPDPATPGPTAGAASGTDGSPELTVVPWGGTYTESSNASRAEVTAKLDGAFKLELFDHHARQVTWRAVVDIHTISTPELSDGQDFADTVLARLRRDHVILCAQ